jgi:site-specific recombinase XerD
MHIEDAVTVYLEHRETDCSPETVQSYGYRLRFFVDWCDNRGLEEIEEIDAQDVHEYKTWRSEGLAKPTIKSQMDTLRSFLRYMERLDYAEEDLHESAVSPTLQGKENIREDIVETDQAKQILERLDRYRFASKEHVLFLIAWRTAARTGALRALDLRDYDSNEQYLRFVNRPDTDTRLKNGDNGERLVALREETCTVLDEFIENKRYDVTDEHGRRPLLASKMGRIAKNTIRGWMYRLTRPCWYANDCPHDRDQSECEAAVNDSYSYECPSSTAAHSVRRGAVTHMLREDVPKTAVSDRVDCSVDVLEKHYSKLSERDKMETRRQYLDGL